MLLLVGVWIYFMKTMQKTNKPNVNEQILAQQARIIEKLDEIKDQLAKN